MRKEFGLRFLQAKIQEQQKGPQHSPALPGLLWPSHASVILSGLPSALVTGCEKQKHQNRIQLILLQLHRLRSAVLAGTKNYASAKKDPTMHPKKKKIHGM